MLWWVDENRERLSKILANRARIDPGSGDFIRDERNFVLSEWAPWERH